MTPSSVARQPDMKRVEQPLRSMLHPIGDLQRLLLSELRSASVGKPLHKRSKKISAVGKQHSVGKQRSQRAEQTRFRNLLRPSRRHFRGKVILTPCWIPSWRP